MMEEILKDFPEGTAKVLRQVLVCEFGELYIHRRSQCYVIENRTEFAFEYDLILKDGYGLPDDCNGLPVWPGELRREGERYALTVTADTNDGEDNREITLFFTGAEARIWAVRADRELWHMEPWMQLTVLACNVVTKAEFFPELVNGQEWALMTLLRELVQLHRCEEDRVGFPELKKRFPPELVSRLERVERGKTWEQRKRYADRLLRILNRSSYEKLWLALWNEAAETQREYHDPTCRSPELERMAADELQSRGYDGKWPNFYKRGTIEKTRLVRSHGHRYLARRGSPACFYIRCHTEQAGQEPCLTIVGATELLRGAEPGGFDTCRFDCGGYGFLHTINIWGDPEEQLALAVKKAELRPLTKQERKNDGYISPLAVFFWTFLIAGGFFALCMTLGMAVLSAAITLLLRGPMAVPEVMSELPWLELIAKTWLLSGGALGLILAHFVRQ